MGRHDKLRRRKQRRQLTQHGALPARVEVQIHLVDDHDHSAGERVFEQRIPGYQAKDQIEHHHKDCLVAVRELSKLELYTSPEHHRQLAITTRDYLETFQALTELAQRLTQPRPRLVDRGVTSVLVKEEQVVAQTAQQMIIRSAQ